MVWHCRRVKHAPLISDSVSVACIIVIVQHEPLRTSENPVYHPSFTRASLRVKLFRILGSPFILTRHFFLTYCKLNLSVCLGLRESPIPLSPS